MAAGAPVAGSPGAGRTPLVAGNWKMYKTAAQTTATIRTLVSALAATSPAVPAGMVLVCPPFTGLPAAREALAGQDPELVLLGAQDMHWETEGAFTGEVSGAMLLDAGCRAVIIGHSERRAHFSETDASAARKVAAAIALGLLPIVCVGETRAEREAGLTAAVLARQVGRAVAGLDANAAGSLVFAYEPVWAIGTGLAASAADASAAADIIRAQLTDDSGRRARVLYGGSVKTGNVAEFMSQPAIDGVLVGGASLDGAGFAALAVAGLRARRQ